MLHPCFEDLRKLCLKDPETEDPMHARGNGTGRTREKYAAGAFAAHSKIQACRKALFDQRNP